MAEIIAPTAAAAISEEITITTRNINQAIMASGDLAADVIPIEKENPDGSWSQVEVEINGVATLIQLTATNMAIGIYAAMGKIRVNKPATGSRLVGVDLGA